MSTDGIDQSPPSSAPPQVPGSGVEAVTAGVTDEDRNRYGVLLDHAAERGLLAPVEYQARLAELADATSVEELQRIVTELPAFGATASEAASTGRAPTPGARPSGGSSGARRTDDPAAVDSVLWASRTPARSRRGSGSQWLVLGIVIVVLVAALVALALVAAHVAHTHHAGSAGPGAAVLSRLRL